MIMQGVMKPLQKKKKHIPRLKIVCRLFLLRIFHIRVLFTRTFSAIRTHLTMLIMSKKYI